VPNLPVEAWLVIGVIIFATIIAVLHCLASAVKLDTHIHDTRVKAVSRQRAYAAQLAEIEAAKQLSEEIEVVGQGPVERLAA